MTGVRRFARDNGLSLVLAGFFLVLLFVGQAVTGFLANNEELRTHGRPALRFGDYLLSPHFLEATAENWESEFLQMFAFVLLTVFLFQKGSAESKKLDEPEAVDRDPRAARDRAGVPWPVRRGGLALALYEHSLSLAFLALFAASFVLHAIGGAAEYNDDRRAHGRAGDVTVAGYLATSRFWFESFQNWQSEFLAIGSMVVLSIWLRERGSPESKPVDAPHTDTGRE